LLDQVQRDSIIPDDRLMLPGISHICLVVYDVEKTARHWADAFGVGPFTIRTVETPETRGEVRGEPAAFTLKFAYAQMGPFVLELVETVSDSAIYQEHLEAKGEGVHHLGFNIPGSLDCELEKWDRAGFKPLMVNRRELSQYGWAYMDTESTAGCILEIVCDPALGWWQTLQMTGDFEALKSNAK